jgi:transposase
VLIEAQHRQAMRLLDEEYLLAETGRKTGAAASSVTRWRAVPVRGGRQALQVRPAPRRPPELSAAQCQLVIKRLIKGLRANSFTTELWTSCRVAALIEQRCKIRYQRSHVTRLPHKFSEQQSTWRALKRDEAGIEAWTHKGKPRRQKSHAAACAHRLRRRIPLHADPQRRAHLGA